MIKSAIKNKYIYGYKYVIKNANFKNFLTKHEMQFKKQNFVEVEEW